VEEVVNGTRRLAGSGCEPAAYLPLYFLFFGLLLGALTLWGQQRFPYVPYTALMFLEGTLIGVVHFATDEGLGDLSISIRAWVNIDAFLLLSVFLPALIFADAMKINFHSFIHGAFWPAMILAVPGVVANGAVVGAVAFYFFGYQWDWFACLLFGSVLGATDPVAMTALLESTGAPQRLTLLMSSEAHLADLTVLVLFKFFLDLVTEGEDLVNEPVKVVSFFARLMLIAPVIGLVAGYGGYFLIKQSVSPTRNSDVMTQITITIVIAYLSFLVSEHNFGSNGIIASVVAAWVIARYAWPKFTNRETMENVWSAIEYTGTTLIFLLAGTILGGFAFNTVKNTTLEGTDVVNALVMWAFLFASRLVIVFFLYPLLFYVSERKFSPQEAVATVFGGIRGAVTITLAIIVLNTAEDDQYESELQVHFGVDYRRQLGKFFFIIGVIVLLTVTVNHMSFGFLLKFLGLLKNSKTQEQLHLHVRKRVQKRAFEVIAEIRKDPAYESVSLDHLHEYVTSTRNMYTQDNGENDEAKGGADLVDPDKVTLEECDPQLLRNVREMFLSALRAQYWDQIELGKLPKKSRAAVVLLDSVEFALDDSADSLNDLEPLKLRERIGKRPLGERAFDCIDSCLPDCITLDNYLQNRLEGLRREEAVYLASCFLEAHICAEQRIAEYVGEDETIDTPEEAFVIKESRQLREIVQQIMDEALAQDPEVVESVNTIKLANAVIESQKNYVRELAEQGIIEPQFLEEQMEEIRADQVRIARSRRNRFRTRASKHASRKIAAPNEP